jgi:hypothetical protein
MDPKKKVLSFLFIRIRNTDGRVYTVSAIMVGGEKFFEGKEKDQIIHLAFNVKNFFFKHFPHKMKRISK